MLGEQVFCYRKISADPLQPEVGFVISATGEKTANVIGWTEHGASFLMEDAPFQSGYVEGSDADFVTTTPVETKAGKAARLAAEAAAKAKAEAEATAKKAADEAAAKAAADAAAKPVEGTGNAAQPVPPGATPLTPSTPPPVQ